MSAVSVIPKFSDTDFWAFHFCFLKIEVFNKDVERL